MTHDNTKAGKTKNIKKAVVKSRNFAFILYPESIPSDFEDCLIKLGVPIAISPLHDKDISERKKEDMTEEEQSVIENGGKIYKKPHYHVLYVARNPVTVESVRKKVKRCLGDKSVSHIEIVDSVAHYYKYLTHESADAVKKKKHKYDKNEIKLVNDFDIERYIFLDESQKKQLKNKLLKIVREYHLVNVMDMLGFLESYGDEVGINHLDDVLDVVGTFPGAFRLWFEGNYQCGFRTRYDFVVDEKTGEIIDPLKK